MFNPELNDLLKIAGCDKYNAELDKQKQIAINERHHREILAAQLESNKIAQEANRIARNAIKKSRNANIIALISMLVAIGSLITAIFAVVS